MSRFHVAMALMLASFVLVVFACGPFTVETIEPKACTSDTDPACDDKNPCTRDSCVSGKCRNIVDENAVPDDSNECTADRCKDGHEEHTILTGSRCGANHQLTCDAQGQCKGCKPGVDDGECPVSLPCRTYACGDDRACHYTDADPGTPVADPADKSGDCHVSQCDGVGGVARVVDTSDKPADDASDCATPGCDSDGAITKIFKPYGIACTGMYTNMFCDEEGGCVACDDVIPNGRETDVDCGGDKCSPCAAGKMCKVGPDCTSGVCTSGICQATCSDKEKNGQETDVDCGGGTCSPCAGKKACMSDNDCESKVCVGNVCQAPSCTDMVQNGTETDLNCGAPSPCLPCGKGKKCSTSANCRPSLTCVEGICCDTACSGICESCTLAGSVGTCSNIPAGHDDCVETTCQCSSTNTCDGSGACVDDGGLKHFGEACLHTDDCFSKKCSGAPPQCQ